MITVALLPDVIERLRAATTNSDNTYAPTQTQLVTRGIELALKELKERGLMDSDAS